jgi:putative ABC transport system permease protein
MVGLRRLVPRGYLFTVVGIAVGLAGLVALGAMAERIGRFVEGGDRFARSHITVAGAGMGMGVGFTAGGLLPRARIAEVAEVPGVAAVEPQVMLPLRTSTSQFLALTQELVLGIDAAAPNAALGQDLSLRQGRMLQPGERGVVVVGADFAGARRLRVGATLPLEGRPFTVVGILEQTLTAPDRFAIVPIADARDLWLTRDPLLVQVVAAGSGLGREDLNSGVLVRWKPGEDPDALARRIQATVPGVNVSVPGEVSRVLRESTAFLSALLLGIGALGLVIGGLSLSNTVSAAVFERIGEFGVKRALGATDGHLLREVLAEALGVSLSGGVLGIGLAWAIGWLVDTRIIREGQQAFVFSPRLVLFALGFAVVLGSLAAAYATLRIARLAPAEAIRRGT